VNATAKLEISVLSVALALGMLGDMLLRVFPWGVNFAIWACLLAVSIFFLGLVRRESCMQGSWWILLPITLSPLAFLWHESPQLKALNLLALFTGLSLALLRARGAQLRVCSLVEYALGGLRTWFNTALGMFPLLLKDREWTNAFRWLDVRKSVGVLLGLVLAFPPLLIFGGLFMGSDAVFRSFALRFLRTVPSHVLMTIFIAYCVSGYLRGLLLGKTQSLTTARRQLPVSLGAIESGVMLGLLDLLFLAFVAVQVRYFFSGSALVQTTTGLTYAEYARRGFFGLVIAAALVLPFLLFVHWLLRPDDVHGQRWFGRLAGVQIALLFIIMASALQRMRLYEAEYGLSEQRLYPTACMGWLAIVFVWFCLTVLRGRRERFAFGAVVAGFLLVAALQVLNPDALIARTNLARAQAGRIFDARYAANLSADATPDLVAGLPTLNAQDRCTVATRLLERWTPPENPDWRSFSYSRTRAWRAIKKNLSALRADCPAINR
jgi:hypothetical protein